ncbi:MAG: 2-dehydropantoate 2-reductase N-terminal domain-containing protein, partial [Longimicrobiales bacterium]
MSDPLLVWGAGAMGGTIGAGLVRAGHEVRFVDRDGDHVAAMRTVGLEITGPVAAYTVAADAVRHDELDGTYERVLLCVKAHETEAALDDLTPFLADDGFVVSVQNGLCEPLIAARVGSRRTLGAFVNFGADRLAPGVVHWGGRGTVAVGEIDGRTRERLRDLLVVLQDFEPDAIRTGNIFGFLWSKLAYAALLFATALTDDPIADVLDAPDHRPTLIGLAREVCRVAAAKGIRLEAFDGFDPADFGP